VRRKTVRSRGARGNLRRILRIQVVRKSYVYVSFIVLEYFIARQH